MRLAIGQDGEADARVATITALVVIVTTLLSPSWIPPLVVLILTLMAALFLSLRGRFRLRTYGRLMALPAAIAAFVWLTFAFTFGVSEAYRILLPVYEEGIAQGFLVFLRVLAASSVLLLLLEATSLMAILRALRWMRVPEVLVELAALVYRYTFVFEEERRGLWQAMVSRLGASKSLGYARRVSNYGLVASNLLIRSFDRSLRTYEAMQSRRYRGGRLFDLRMEKPGFGEICLGGLVSSASVLLVLMWWLPW